MVKNMAIRSAQHRNVTSSPGVSPGFLCIFRRRNRTTFKNGKTGEAFIWTGNAQPQRLSAENGRTNDDCVDGKYTAQLSWADDTR